MWLDPEQGPAGVGRLFHFHGMSAAATWGNLAVVMRFSDDCGDTWSAPSIVLPEHGLRHQPVNTMFRLQDGRILMPCDNNTEGSGGTAIHFSSDGGYTWTDEEWTNDVLGIHGTVAELANGTLQAFGRGNDIDGNMARSISTDGGYSWAYSASTFPGIGGGQRASQLRLASGNLLFCSFASSPMAITTACNTTRDVTGLYCAASTSNGDAWEYRRLVTDDRDGTLLEALDGNLFVMNQTSAEPNGYTVARQSSFDGTIHLISSRNHYRFNEAWLLQRAPC
jgi:hypothetical protein